MAIETRLRETGPRGGGGASGSSNSAGLAGTGIYYIVGSNASTLPLSKVLSAGANVTITTNAVAIFVSVATGSGSPGGSSTNIQVNDGGVFYGDSGLIYNKSNQSIDVQGTIAAGNLGVISTNALLDLEHRFNTPDTDLFGNYTYLQINPSSDGSSFSAIGNYIRIIDSGSTVRTQSLYGQYVDIDHTIDQSLTSIVGFESLTTSSSKVQNTSIKGIESIVSVISTGGSAVAFGIYSEVDVNSVSSSGNVTGLHASAVIGGGPFDTTYISNLKGINVLLQKGNLCNVSTATLIYLDGGVNSIGALSYGVYQAGSGYLNVFESDVKVPNEAYSITTWSGNFTVPTKNSLRNKFESVTTGFFVVGSASPTLPGSRILTAGSSITVRTDGTSIYIDALTGGGAGASTAGLAGTGAYYIVGSATPAFPNSKIITAGSSISLRTDSTSIYIDASTGGGGSVSDNVKLMAQGVTIDGSSSVILTGFKGTYTMPYNGTIKAWSITAEGSSPTCTFDVWKIAQGTALPTVSNTIMGTKPTLTVGNAVYSTDTTAWTTVSVISNDIIGYNLDSCSRALRITFQLHILKS